jgi:hypothetical protein
MATEEDLQLIAAFEDTLFSGDMKDLAVLGFFIPADKSNPEDLYALHYVTR